MVTKLQYGATALRPREESYYPSRMSFRPWWFLVVASPLLLVACGGHVSGPGDGGDHVSPTDVTGHDVTMIDSPIPDVADVPPVDVVKDAPPDVNVDVADDVAADVTDGGVDAPIDVPGESATDVASDAPWDPCASGSVIDLSTAGTVSGATTTYNGDTSSTPAMPTAMGLACAGGHADHVVALRYTTRTASRLIISTFHAATLANFDTVAWAQSTCDLAGTGSLGCNDDVPMADQARMPGPPGSATRESIFTTANTARPDLTLPAGTTVYIFVGGFVGTMIGSGAFQLTVTEATPPSPTGGPCEPAASVTLCAMAATCTASGSDYSSFACEVAGALGGPCRMAAPQCDAGLGCDRMNTCVTGVAIGLACDPSGMLNTCVSGSHCIMQTSGAFCIADGTAGGRCNASAPACNSGLGCNVNNVCEPIVAVGATCDPTETTNVCAAGSHCITQMASSTCVADGATGGRCRASGVACDAPNVCTGPVGSAASRCLPVVPAGGACDPTLATNRCASGSVCVPSGTSGSCAAHTYTTSASTATWIDACAAAGATTALAGSDDGTTPVTLPFAITYFGINHPASTITTASADGWMSFRSGAPQIYTPAPFPVQTPDDAIYPLFIDLFFHTGTPTPQLCVATTGTTPTRTFVVEWLHDGYYTPMTPTDFATFELQFHEGSAAFDALYNGSAGTEFVNAATIGAESTGGTSYVSVCAGTTAPSGCTATSLANTHYTPVP